MSHKLFQDYDGANAQARAVLAYLSRHDGIEPSWNKEQKEYDANPQVSRWENCREQGYVVRMRDKTRRRQINIAWFEHRNSDAICALMWEQVTINAPTIDTADFGGKVYRDKYDVSYQVGHGEVVLMSNWIYEQLTDFWTIAGGKE